MTILLRSKQQLASNLYAVRSRSWSYRSPKSVFAYVVLSRRKMSSVPVSSLAIYSNITQIRDTSQIQSTDFLFSDIAIQNSSSFFEASIIRARDVNNPAPVPRDCWDENTPPEIGSSSTEGLYFDRYGPNILIQRAAIPERSNNTDLEPQWEGSHSWFLQANHMANVNPVIHEIVWGREGEWEGGEGSGKGEGFVENLEPGDRIAVWARATRRGWENRVSRVKVDIRYTVL